jgi:Porin subfamily
MFRKSLCAAAFCCAAAFLWAGAPARADDVTEIKAQIQALNERLSKIEQQQAQAKAAATPAPSTSAAPAAPAASAASAASAVPPDEEPVVGGAFPGSFKLPGTNTSIGLHGWVSLQSFYDSNQYVGDKFAIGNLLPNGDAQAQTQGTYHMQGKLTRFIIESQTPTSFGNVKTYLASDFYGYENGGATGGQTLQNNNYGLRVVHAYVALGGFLAGKTWSNFIDDADGMESLDNAGPAGVPSEQVPQIRYTFRLDPRSTFGFSAESPATDYAGNLTTVGTEQASQYGPVPDLTAKYETEQRWGHVQASAVLRKLAYDDGAGHRSMASAGGAIVGTTLNLPRKTSIGFQTWFGDGIQRFSPDDFGPVSSAQINYINTAQQVLVPSPESGVTTYMSHRFSRLFRSNLGYGYDHMYWNAFIPANSSQPVATHTLHANLIFSPGPLTDFGFEFMRGTKTFRDILNLPEAFDNRYEFAVRSRF